MAQETMTPALTKPAEPPPVQPEDAVARVDGKWLTKAEVVAWLKTEGARAEGKTRDGSQGYNVHGAFVQMQACEKLRQSIAGWNKAAEDKARANPIDLRAELARVKEKLV